MVPGLENVASVIFEEKLTSPLMRKITLLSQRDSRHCEMLRRHHKRQRIDAAPQSASSASVDGDDDDAAAASLFDDTLATVELLMERNRSGFERMGLPPVVLRHQLYTILSNRTFVDQNLWRLRQSGTLICFRVPTGADDIAIVRQSDYCGLITKREAELGLVFDGEAAARRDKADDAKKLAALAAFRKCVEEITKRSVLTLGTLVEVFVEEDGETDEAVCREHVGQLQKMGFLLTTARLDEQGYQVSMPGVGKVVSAVKKTRASIVQTLHRTKYKESFEHQLKKIKLRHSQLSLDYHLADMEGAGLIRRTQATSGTLVSVRVKQRNTAG